MKDDDRLFVLDTLQDIFILSAQEGLVSTLEAIASELGVSQIQGIPIEEYYERKRRAIAENHVADFADMNMKLASHIKEEWKKLDAKRASQETGER
jgi:hypothetical protein